MQIIIFMYIKTMIMNSQHRKSEKCESRARRVKNKIKVHDQDTSLLSHEENKALIA